MQNIDLRKVGLKVTLPRTKILQIMESAKEHHLSAEDVYRKLLESDENAGIGLATVYRVLTQFKSAGLVIQHNFEGGHSVFELDQGEHHDHLVCVKCGQVAEFNDPTIEERQEVIAKQKGFEITDHSLTIYGTCSDCNQSV